MHFHRWKDIKTSKTGFKTAPKRSEKIEKPKKTKKKN
jgi:hypothetical protein